MVEPLLSSWPIRALGPRPIDDQRCLQGILFVLHTGIGWEDLPAELGLGSEMICWRRLRCWTEAGVFEKLHRVLRAKLHAAGAIDWSGAVADAAQLRANKGAPGLGRARSTGAARARSII